MIKSMTGFAAATVEADGTTATATLKSVNHRFLDLQMRLPQTLSPGEQALRSIVQQRVARGRVEATLSVQSRRVTTLIATDVAAPAIIRLNGWPKSSTSAPLSHRRAPCSSRVNGMRSTSGRRSLE